MHQILPLSLILAGGLYLCAAQNATGPSTSPSNQVNPVFIVVTIKPSDPNNSNWALGTKGTHFFSSNTDVDDLISFAYEIHKKQIVGAPAWFQADKYDVEGVPDTQGKPSRQQLATMVQGLLADRFKLVVHRDKKQLAVYALTVGKSGPRLAKSTAPADGPAGYGFGPLGTMKVTNMTMASFASALQRTVLDKPLVDQTRLQDRYDFVLKWTPDDSQFSQIRGTGIRVPTGSGDPNAPPGLYTAIEEELGLKLEPVKALTDVLVVDHAEKPSAN